MFSADLLMIVDYDSTVRLDLAKVSRPFDFAGKEVSFTDCFYLATIVVRG